MQSVREEVWELERVRYVTENYPRLQGLRKVTLGLLMLLLVGMFVFFLVRPPESDAVLSTLSIQTFLAVIAAVFAGAFGLYFWIKDYYDARYGSVISFESVPTRRKVLYVAMVLAVLNSSVGFILFMGIAMYVAYWRDRHFQMHYVALALTSIAWSLLFVMGMAASFAGGSEFMDIALWVYEWGRLFTLTIVGLYFVGGGVLDHLLLVRTMKFVPEER